MEVLLVVYNSRGASCSELMPSGSTIIFLCTNDVMARITQLTDRQSAGAFATSHGLSEWAFYFWACNGPMLVARTDREGYHMTLSDLPDRLMIQQCIW